MPTDDPRSDDQLLRAYARGDAGAFDALYQRHRHWAAAVAYRFTRDPHETMDVLQESFAYLILKAPTLRLEVPIRSLLYPVIKHTALARRRRVHPSVPIEAESLGGASDASASVRDETLAALQEALGQLPEAQRETLLMRTVDGMSLAEIAGALLIPVGTVKSRLHLALQSLHADQRLRGYFRDEIRPN